MAAARSHPWPPSLPWSTPPGGGRCTNPTSRCTNPAAPGRYICEACAAEVDRRARKLRARREDQETRNRRRDT